VKPTTEWTVEISNCTKTKMEDIKNAVALITTSSLDYKPKEIHMVSMDGPVSLAPPISQYINTMEAASCNLNGGLLTYFWDHIERAMQTKEGIVTLDLNEAHKHAAFIDFTKIGMSDLPTDLLRVDGHKYIQHLTELMSKLPKESNPNVRVQMKELAKIVTWQGDVAPVAH